LVFKDGSIIEEGTHTELMEANGIYHDMVKSQKINREKEKEALSAIKG
jgi:ATP-binding cassette subfamily B (MDR/TAP) protein 1